MPTVTVFAVAEAFASAKAPVAVTLTSSVPTLPVSAAPVSTSVAAVVPS